MKRNRWNSSGALLIVCLIAWGAVAMARQEDVPRLKGPYLGQKPPGMTPEVFAPGIVSKDGPQAKLFFTRDGNICWVSAEIIRPPVPFRQK